MSEKHLWKPCSDRPSLFLFETGLLHVVTVDKSLSSPVVGARHSFTLVSAPGSYILVASGTQCTLFLHWEMGMSDYWVLMHYIFFFSPPFTFLSFLLSFSFLTPFLTHLLNFQRDFSSIKTNFVLFIARRSLSFLLPWQSSKESYKTVSFRS